MSEHVYFLALIDKLPTFDPTWPGDVAARWFACFDTLWRWGCRLTVEAAINAYVEARTEGGTDAE